MVAAQKDTKMQNRGEVNYSGERKQPTSEGEYFRPPLTPGASTPDQENLRGRPADVGREKASSMKI